MTTVADNLSEQLSAFMDGELPEAEARFLQRRLEHDLPLRAQWDRMQLASSCLKGHAVRPMRPSLQVDTAAEAPFGATGARRRPLWGWAVAASVALLAVLFVPRMDNADSAVVPAGIAQQVSGDGPLNALPSPSSADLVASQRRVEPSGTTVAQSAGTVDTLVADASLRSRDESPLPLSDSQSPSDFPLAEAEDPRTWPRSQLAVAAGDPSLEAYLVRHNQMMANDGLGGFVPYVDVVASEQAAGTSDEVTASGDDSK